MADERPLAEVHMSLSAWLWQMAVIREMWNQIELGYVLHGKHAFTILFRDTMRHRIDGLKHFGW